ncbi:hypothetical protein Tco_1062590 [Tanacetum coccineum]
MNVPIFVGTFSVVTDFAVLENMDAYRDEGIGDVIFGEPFLREVGIKTRRFEGMISIYNGDDEVTYQMVRSHLRFKHHTNEQCNKIPPLLKVSNKDKKNGISHPYQKIKGFYKGVLNLGPDYIRDARTDLVKEISMNIGREFTNLEILKVRKVWDDCEVDRYGNANLVIMEYFVNISKRRAFWSLNKDILKINDSDYQYAVSIKEDTAYPYLHSPKTTKEISSIRRIKRIPICRIKDIVCEDSGRYQAWSLLQETPQYAVIRMLYADALIVTELMCLGLRMDISAMSKIDMPLRVK